MNVAFTNATPRAQRAPISSELENQLLDVLAAILNRVEAGAPSRDLRPGLRRMRQLFASNRPVSPKSTTNAAVDCGHATPRENIDRATGDQS